MRNISKLGIFNESKVSRSCLVSSAQKCHVYNIVSFHDINLTTSDIPTRSSCFPPNNPTLHKKRMLNGLAASENETTFSHTLSSLHIGTGTHHQFFRAAANTCLDNRVCASSSSIVINDDSPENLIPLSPKSGGQLEYLKFVIIISVVLDMYMISQCLAHTPLLTSVGWDSDLVLNYFIPQEGYADREILVGWYLFLLVHL